LLDLVQVRTFVTVARERSFTRAANSLHYAQSSVTAQVQQLESQLGAPLFDRLPRALDLTAAGQSFLPYAERLLALVEESCHAVHQLGAPTGALCVSACESVLTYRLPSLLRSFQANYPAVTLSLDAPGICEYGPPVQSGVDIGVSISERITDPQLISHILRTEPICAIVSCEHPLATKRSVSAADIVAEQLLLTEESCSYRGVFEKALGVEGARRDRALAFASVEAIKQCAIARMGVAVLPEMVVAEELRTGTLVALRWHPTRLKVYTQLVRRRDKWFSPTMQAFWNAAVEELTVKRSAAA
jgi:DNA-binding transcriptional LysR family regulator